MNVITNCIGVLPENEKASFQELRSKKTDLSQEQGNIISMTIQNTTHSIKEYLNKIPTIFEGTRNTTLYQEGHSLRRKFGLSGKALLTQLLEINRGKCSPPLPADEVAAIAKSVNGSPIDGASVQSKKPKTPKEKSQTTYYISATADPVPVADLLKKEVSIYQNCYSNTPTRTSNIGTILQGFKTGGNSKVQILAVRNEPDKEKRSELKKGLYAITFSSEPQAERKIAACKANGIVVLDFDNIPAEELESAKAEIAAVDYVFAVCLSVSGRGLFAFAAYEGTPDLKILIQAMQSDFHYLLDKACSDISRLRIVTMDENLVLKDSVCRAELREEQEPFANENIPEQIDNQTVLLSEPIVRNPLLRSLLELTKPIDFTRIVQTRNAGKITQKIYQVATISQIIEDANKSNLGLAVNNGFIYLFDGSFWTPLDKNEFKAFLASAAIRAGVPELDARHHTFREELHKQFMSDGYQPSPPESTATLINLKNGTFEITEAERKLRPPLDSDFLKHQLSFEHQEDATAPLFQKFLERVLPEQELQMVLAEFIGYIFVSSLKLEKVLILYGTGANGKSVFFEVIYALLGRENVSCYKLSSLTRTSSYERAELQNKLLNYASELNGTLEADTFKQLASGEPIEARRIYQDPFLMRRYAKLMFNANELPREVENTDAFFRRFIIVPFRQTIPESEQDPRLAQKIVASELPGVFNWVLAGLERLLHNHRFTESDIVRNQIEEYKQESDSVAMFLSESAYEQSTSKYTLVSQFYESYKEFCKTDGYRALGKKNFTKRCRALGFIIEKKRKFVIYAAYAGEEDSSKCPPVRNSPLHEEGSPTQRSLRGSIIDEFDEMDKEIPF